LAIFQEQLPTVKVWNEFKFFAETALDFKELLKLIDPHIHKKKVGVWKLSVFRPERKNDSGEFIPP
jgi:hypothetical protein